MVYALIVGLSKLKKGALYTLLSQVLIMVAIVLVLITVGWLPMGAYASPEKFYIAVFYKLGSVIVPLIGLLLASMVLGLAGFILFFVGTGYLKESNPKYGIGRVGMILQLVGLVLMIVAVVPFAIISGPSVKPQMAISTLFSAVGLLILGGILIVVGAILFGVMLMRMDDIESNFKTAGILYLLGIILNFVISGVGSILMIASLILIYETSSRAIESRALSNE